MNKMGQALLCDRTAFRSWSFVTRRCLSSWSKKITN